MREIKFRGVTPRNQTVYGDLLHQHGRVLIYDGAYYYVAPESVSQLISEDANNREVYEGDKVIRIRSTDETFDASKSFPMAAGMEDLAAIELGEVIKV